MIIGKLVHKKWIAYLTTKGWECKNKDVLFLLQVYEPGLRRFYGQDRASYLPAGFEALHAAGKDLGAKVFLSSGLMHNKPDVLY